MVTTEELETRAAMVAGNADLESLLAAMQRRGARTVLEMPHVPQVKALLSQDGGVCPEDGTQLLFDPWAPADHLCPQCRRTFSGERHNRHWARFQHLWLAEQAAELAAIGVMAPDEAASARADDILAAYAHYASLPNLDNVLGPSHLFFSTYLESIWITNYLAAAVLLRESGRLGEGTIEVVSSVADEAAAIIGEFNEGFSNRQTWHNAALAAIGVWFEDEELAGRAIESESGLLAHFAHGFASDGTWHEGENYHLFALQGALTGLRWARSAGVDPLGDPELAGRIAAALRAPIRTALPDLTFPARKDSRFAVSLAQPMYIELWERGLGIMSESGEALVDVGGWIRSLYAAPAPAANAFDSWLYEAGLPARARRTRADLSWNALLEMTPALPEGGEVRAVSAFLPYAGLAVLRRGDRYVSLECGDWTGGHGHPDRLHLSIHAGGVHWLPDFGTGSYVSGDLFWYRSTLAHNAPLLDGTSQPGGDASCTAFQAGEDWSWVRGTWGPVTRTAVSGPDYVIDVLELNAEGERTLELPWHLDRADVVSPGAWVPDAIESSFVSSVERFVPSASGPLAVRGERDGRTLTLHFAPGAALLRGECPPVPGGHSRRTFLLERVRAPGAQLVAVIGFRADAIRGIRVSGTSIEVDTEAGTDVHSALLEGWDIRSAAGSVRLGGIRAPEREFEPLITRQRALREHATVPFAAHAPAVDGSDADFAGSAMIHLDHDDQYRRSEEPYAGLEEFSASARLLWDEDALYVAVDVVKADPAFRPAAAPPLRFDNEVDDIHSDGIQVYLRAAGGPAWGVLAVPEVGGGVRVSPVSDTAGSPDDVRAGWSGTATGYRITLALSPPFWDEVRDLGIVDFDLLVNEMRSGRERRAGQLVWTGGGGWVWLRGDRQAPERFGVLELA
ncbi:MAG TPA: heparinase II/III family protein [Gemmatimonadales bacterium]|nr:heparinase II/III family protein [Gemmatimonadales bacterium]